MSKIKLTFPKRNTTQFKFLAFTSFFLLIISYGVYEIYSSQHEKELRRYHEEKENLIVHQLTNFLQQEINEHSELKLIENIQNIFHASNLYRLVVRNEKDSILINFNTERLSKESLDDKFDDELTNFDQAEIFTINKNVVTPNSNSLNISYEFLRSDLNTKIAKLKIEAAIISLIVFVISFLVLFVGSFVIGFPLEKIATEALEISNGNLSKRIDDKTTGEFANLAHSINMLAEDLQKANQQIEKLNKELKFQVRDKIGELNYEINRKRQAESLLKQSEEQFRLLFELAPIGMVISSIYGQILKVNEAFYKTLGYSQDEVIGMKIGELTFKDDKLMDAQLHDNLIDGIEQHAYYEKRLVRKDGEIINVIVEAVAVKDKTGKPSHIIEQVIDITDRKKVEKELIYAKEKAEESDRLKTAFLAQMSHEIRTPLNVILAAMNLIQDDLDDSDPDTKTILESVSSAGKRLQRTIDLILNISAVQSGSYEPEMTDINLDKELRILIEEFRTMENEKGLTISYIKKTKHNIIHADHYSTLQIFQNLISNAVKYTLKGKVEIILDDWDANKLQVIVKDTGIGISKDYISKLFSPFSQEDVGHKREFEGNGLGLALVKKYVEINNADILVESEKNRGSVFTVIFNKKVDSSKEEESKSFEHPKIIV